MRRGKRVGKRGSRKGNVAVTTHFNPFDKLNDFANNPNILFVQSSSDLSYKMFCKICNASIKVALEVAVDSWMMHETVKAFADNHTHDGQEQLQRLARIENEIKALVGPNVHVYVTANAAWQINNLKGIDREIALYSEARNQALADGAATIASGLINTLESLYKTREQTEQGKQKSSYSSGNPAWPGGIYSGNSVNSVDNINKINGEAVPPIGNSPPKIAYISDNLKTITQKFYTEWNKATQDLKIKPAVEAEPPKTVEISIVTEHKGRRFRTC